VTFVRLHVASIASAVPAVANNGFNQHSVGFDKNEHIKPSDKGGTSSTYRIGKLKRDHPDVATEPISIVELIISTPPKIEAPQPAIGFADFGEPYQTEVCRIL
jgi:hypothetical protein